MVLLENKKTLVQKPRFKNFLIGCGPIRTSGSNQVGLFLYLESIQTVFKTKAHKHTKKDTLQRLKADLHVKQAIQMYIKSLTKV
jgi:hypothetical protein